jgi:phosphate transport system permease protein
MQPFYLIVALLLLSVAGFYMGRSRAVATVGGRAQNLHSLPSYHGLYVALWCGIPSLFILAVWLIAEPHLIEWVVIGSIPGAADLPANQIGLIINDVKNLAAGLASMDQADPAMVEAAERLRSLRITGFAALGVVALAIAIAGLVWSWRRISPTLRARNRVERAIMGMLIVCSTISIATTVGIVMSLLFESLRFFEQVPFLDFVFGLQWSPQTAIRTDQVGSSGTFGAIPLFVGTLVVTMIAMLVAVPIGLMSAIYMADYAHPKVRAVVKPLLEILAGIPTVVYGFFAALTVAPFIRGVGESIGIDVASESALAAGLVMGVMIIPFVSSLSDDVMNAVPQTLRDGSYALGATKSETIRQVVLPAALPGIVGAVLLAVSRAIGETMIVVMAAGLSANLTINPLEAVTTVTVQIVTLLVGDQEFDSAKTLAAFALGLVLFTVTLGLNVIALGIVRKYREKYD